MSASENREKLAQFGMTDAELDAWFDITAVAGAIGELMGWNTAEAHDMAHSAHVVQSFLLSRPVVRAAGSRHAPGDTNGTTEPAVQGSIASRAQLARAGLTDDEIDLCASIANVAARLHALPGLPRYSWHGCGHALRRLQDLVIGNAVIRAAGLPRPTLAVDETWAPDAGWLGQARDALVDFGMTEQEIDACAAITGAARRVHTLPALHPTAWHDSMHAFRAAEESVLARPGMRAQGWG